MGRTQAIGAGLALVAVLVGGGLGSSRSGSPPIAPQESIAEAEPVTGSSVLTVHVSGWVTAPGVVTLPPGSIVADAVAAAGGAMQGALLDSINLAAPVADGEHIAVPGPGEGVSVAANGGTNGGLISLNQADAAALESLPGVGPVLAERIVAYREANGPFQTVEDLLEVSGIGESKLAAIRDLVSVP